MSILTHPGKLRHAVSNNYQNIFRVSYMTNRLYQSHGELCMNAGGQQCAKQNFTYQLAKYR